MSYTMPRIIRSARTTLALQVTSNAQLVVKAPTRTPMRLIQQFIDKNTDWIERQVMIIQSRTQDRTKQYKEGEVFLFLGEPHVLMLEHRMSIGISKGKIHFPHALLFRAQKELEMWYRKAALEYINKRVIYFAARMHVEYKSVSVADTKSRWGACTHDNRLQFNWHLIMTPPAVLDSVVVHELAHTIVKNHSSAFWSQVLRIMPGYKAHRAWINHNSKKLVV